MFISTVIMGFFCMAVLAGCSGKSPVEVQREIERKYGVILPFALTQQMIYAYEWGYIILDLSSADLKNLLEKPVPEFSPWEPYKDSISIGCSNVKSFRIDGANSDHYMVAWNHSPTKHKCDKLAIFVDFSRNLLIFHDGIISRSSGSDFFNYLRNNLKGNRK